MYCLFFANRCGNVLVLTQTNAAADHFTNILLNLQKQWKLKRLNVLRSYSVIYDQTLVINNVVM